jgi:hypothetical protein
MLLNAGFDSNMAMPGLTGSMRRAFASKPPISRPGAISADIHLSLQQTRITGSSENASVPASETHLVPTRVPTEAAPAQPYVSYTRDSALTGPPVGVPNESSTTASPSFFSRFGVGHYIAAGAIVLLLIGGAVALPFILLAPGTSASNPEAQQSSIDQSEEPAAATLQETLPEAVPPQTETSSPAVIEPSLSEPALPGVPEPPVEDTVKGPETDRETGDDEDVEKRNDNKTQPVKRPPTTLKKSTAPPPKRKSGGCTTERRLTGQCV